MMLRPLFVTGNLAHGGAERHSITLMNRLAERGHDCHAVYVKNETHQLERIRTPDEGCVRCLNADGFLDRRAVRDLAAHIARLRPSVLVAANGYALMYAVLGQMFSGLRVPVVATFHTTQLADAKDRLRMLIARPFFWRSRCTVFVCETQKAYWLRRGVGSRHNVFIHNGVDTEHFRDRSCPAERQALRQTFGFGPADYVIGISAVLRPEKNHLQLVDAVATLRRLGIPARILMIGDGPLRAAVETRSRALGVADSVRITGYVQDVRPCLAICDVLALCSLSIETFSLAALEAMAMGKPVVHSELGGAAEMVFPGHNGYLFRPGDTGELIYRLLVLADYPLAESMGAAARQLVETRFSESVMVDRYEHVLVDVCASNPAVAKTESLHADLRPGGLSGTEVKQGANSHENV